jgi:ribosomal protein L44E
VDRHVTTSTKNRVVSIQTHVQSVTNPILAWWDSLNDDEQRSERENAKLKAPLLKARSAAAAKAAAGQRRAARKQKAIDGQTKETNRTSRKPGGSKPKTSLAFATEELEAGLLKTTTKTEKEKLVSEELEVYKEFYKAVVLVTKDEEEMTLDNARDDDGLPYWQKTNTGKQQGCTLHGFTRIFKNFTRVSEQETLHATLHYITLHLTLHSTWRSVFYIQIN